MLRSLSVKKTIFFAAGWICVALGILGALLPLLPTTPFLLAALFFFGHASPRLAGWLLRWPLLRGYYENYRCGTGVPLRAKIISLVFLWLALGGSALLFHRWWYWAVLAAVGCGVSTHLLRLKTKK